MYALLVNIVIGVLAVFLFVLWNVHLHRNKYGEGSFLPSLWRPKEGQSEDDWFPPELRDKNTDQQRRVSRARR
jgi:hypothetical protein